ncbi:uncharacterized protein BDW43DRAFT_307427 [Aspergillus alliaceus]|uniref:uncharacterized protein n=1 Tax=Petromyces alliaceus TaxID=209559 RepID=UPI0012A559CB|nr:uncharacterized protein BDW43DRAFT_307427 [Aspergillus alliaceus]KAB8237146.1 hypothetical protein BDW43DRAFT_307427 [Aspergillus alliaceus]
MEHVKEQGVCQTVLHVEVAVLRLDEKGLTIEHEQNRATRHKIRRVRFLFVLWVEANVGQLKIQYAEERRKVLEVKRKVYQLLDPGTSSTRVQGWVQLLLDRAYGKSKARKHLKVFLNPLSGAGSAVKWYYQFAVPLFTAAQCHVDLQETRSSGQAMVLT